MILLPILVVGFSCCVNKFANADIDSKTEHALHTVSLAGIYEGNLPCADCTAISTTLVLNNNRSYDLYYIYVGKSEQQFIKDGSWEVRDGILVLDNEDYNYRISDGKLHQLDLSGRDITGDLADKYTLRRVER